MSEDIFLVLPCGYQRMREDYHVGSVLSMISLREIESALTSALPIAWEEAEGMRAKKGKSLPYWSKWCYLPLAGWIVIASRGCDVSDVNPDHTQAAALFAAVGAWRVGRGVYRFDETLFDELISTPMEGNIPCDVLFRLPEWCVYRETEPLGFPGVFVHLEEDANSGERELRFLFHEADGNLIPAVIHLGNYPLSEGVRRSIQTSKLHMDNAGLPYTSERMALDAAAIMAKAGNIVPLILYICSANAEIRQVKRVEPTPKPRKKRPPKMPLSPATWEVGYRIGAAIRAGRSKEEEIDRGENRIGSGIPKRPHVRRAHWHGYWTGPRDGKRLFSLKWLPPIPINVDTAGDGPVVIHPVEEEV